MDISIQNIGKNAIKDFYYFGDEPSVHTFKVESNYGQAADSAFIKRVRKEAKAKAERGMYESSKMVTHPDLQPGQTFTERIPLQRYVDMSDVAPADIKVQLKWCDTWSNTISTNVRAEPYDLSDHKIRKSVTEEWWGNPAASTKKPIQ